MSLDHLSYLNIDVEYVNRAVDFLEAYGRGTLEEYRARVDERNNRFNPVRDPELDQPSDAEWVMQADAASALREAAQWAVFLDLERARNLLVQAAVVYNDLGYAFGMYLMVVAGSWALDPPWEVFTRAIEDLRTLHGQGAESASERTHQQELSQVPPPMHYPQQQAYCLAACTGSRAVAREFWPTLYELARDSPHRLGVTPVGALGTAIRRFWEIALYLLPSSQKPQVDSQEPQVGRVLDHLVAMSRVYSEAMGLASANSHLWRHASAPVEPADMDIVGLTTLAVYRFGRQAVQQAFLERGRDLIPVARTPIELGIELASPPDDSPQGANSPIRVE